MMPCLVPEWAAAAKPPPAMSVSEWADAYRKLPDSSAYRGGRWQTSRTPYLKGIMDAVHEPGVRKIALMKAAQVGGSEALHNILAYFIAYDPCPMLFVHPIKEAAEEWSKERLADMVRSTEALSSAIYESESTLMFKLFAGGFLALGGANTPNTFARRAVAKAFGDDVDRWPAVVGDEGDPADLIENRTRTFLDGLLLFVSTPTLKRGRIDTLFTRSDQRRYVLNCPGCGREDWTTWREPNHFSVKYDSARESARLACPTVEYGGCGALMDEPERREMVRHGRWKPTADPVEPGLVGFHLPAMIATIGDVTLERLVELWQAARACGTESTRVFINTALAEGWEDRGARVEAHSLLSKREFYGPGVEVPAQAAAITCGVDVQLDRFELQVIAWGPAEERWVIDFRAIPGNPKHVETRQALAEALQRRYHHASGVDLPIHATCVDSGYATDEIYDFVLAYQARGIYCVKGYGGRSGEPIVGRPSEKRTGKSPRPVRVYPVNTDDAKAEILASASLIGDGAGKMHFPELVDEEYFSQLCAEHRETRHNRAGIATNFVWVPHRERNEALDTAVYALAAYRLLRPNILQMLAAIGAAATSKATDPRPTTPAPAQRRVSRSGYLEGSRGGY